MCDYVDNSLVAPGWGCCHCVSADGSRIYNGIGRPCCKWCGAPSCSPLTPDRATGRTFADRKHFREGLPQMGIQPIEDGR